MHKDKKTTTKVQFGQVLRDLRARSKKTQWAVGTACEIHASTISAWERGTVVPSSANLVRVLRFYGVSESQIDVIYRQTDRYVTHAVQ